MPSLAHEQRMLKALRYYGLDESIVRKGELDLTRLSLDLYFEPFR